MATSEQISTLCEILDIDNAGIRSEMKLSSIDGWDSMAIMMLSYYIYERYQRRVSAADIRNCTTVQQVVDRMHP